jgi:hypothetical protein
MRKPGDIISYTEMCLLEGVSLQRGMNYQVKGGRSVILMSLRKGAPYSDRIENQGQTLIYEGHDLPRNVVRNPKTVDQPMINPNGMLTQNGKFYNAAKNHANGELVEVVNVYEKLQKGIWVYNGVFQLIDAWIEFSIEENRKVFKFKLVMTDNSLPHNNFTTKEITILNHNRIIPTTIKIEVYKRDKGKCTICGSSDNLHFDHILPFSKGGTSLKAENIQLLCARHNLSKGDKLL